MKRRKRRVWSDADKAKVVEHSLTHTRAETAREFGCSVGAVSEWAKAAGVERNVDREAQTRAATEASRMRRAELHEQARADLAEAIAGIAKAAKTMERLPAGDMWKLATTIEVLVRVIRLESGEATGRSDVHVNVTDAERKKVASDVAKLIAEAEAVTAAAAD